MEITRCPFPLTGPAGQKIVQPCRPRPTTVGMAIRPPPAGFNYMTETYSDSAAAVGRESPELLDLVEQGSLVVVEKRRFGPVPSWRSEFIEPEVIFLVGTSHVSDKSAVDVGRVVRTLRPDNVVVELCRSRAGIMYSTSNNEAAAPLLKDNMFSLSGPKFLDAVSRSINLGGQSVLALRMLLAAFSSKISSDTKQSFGEEFRAARIASEEIDAQIVLGDRPIEITLERAWNSLKWDDKLRLVSSLFRGITSKSPVMPQGYVKGEEADGISPYQLYKQLSFSYPSLLQPLLHERDVYLAWSLKRSKAVNNSKMVVGIIGKGHLNGVVHALISDQGNVRIRDIAGSRSSDNWTGVLLKGLARDTIICIAIWFLFGQFNGTS